MELKEKFKIINCNDCDMPYCEIKCTILKPSELNTLEIIADDFALNFANFSWNKILITINEIDLFEYRFNVYSAKELLEIYKKEKQL